MDDRPAAVAWMSRHKVLTGVAVTVALLLVVGLLSPSESKPDSAISADSERDSPATSPTSEVTATPTARPTAVTALPPSAVAVAPGTALALLGGLPVKGRAPKTGYSRDQFGQAWADTNRNGCDTRNDMLHRDLTNRTIKAGTEGCVVLSGTLNDPYTATAIAFARGGASEVDIDHVVALSDAWQKGAQPWPVRKRLAFANDPLNLLAVDASANRQKSDGDAATWLPSNTSYRCAYVGRQVAVKARYGLWVVPAEHDAIRRILSTCATLRAPKGTAPTIAPIAPSVTRTSPPKAATPTQPRPKATNLCGAPTNPMSYSYCSGSLIYDADGRTCAYFSCINNFHNGVGYMIVCQDGMVSMSGGRRGSCSYHGGLRQPVYS